MKGIKMMVVCYVLLQGCQICGDKGAHAPYSSALPEKIKTIRKLIPKCGINFDFTSKKDQTD